MLVTSRVEQRHPCSNAHNFFAKIRVFVLLIFTLFSCRRLCFLASDSFFSFSFVLCADDKNDEARLPTACNYCLSTSENNACRTRRGFCHFPGHCQLDQSLYNPGFAPQCCCNDASAQKSCLFRDALRDFSHAASRQLQPDSWGALISKK